MSGRDGQRGRGQCFGAGFDSVQHLSGHHEVGRNDHRPIPGRHPPPPQACPGTKHESGATGSETVQSERPGPVDPRAEPLGGLRWQILGRVQHKVPSRFEEVNHEPAPSLRCTIRDPVANREQLQPGHEVICAGVIRREQQSVDPGRRLPLTAMPAHLHQPWPDGLVWGVKS
jgi:hypothetical protein